MAASEIFPNFLSDFTSIYLQSPAVVMLKERRKNFI